MRDLLAAYDNDDDDALASAYDEIRAANYERFITFTTQEAQRNALAQKRKNALTRFRKALSGRGVQQIATAYDNVLNDDKRITTNERNTLRAAQEFAAAYRKDDDEGIIATSNAVQSLSPHANITFTRQEQQRITLAQQRMAALAALRLALTSKSMQQIAAAYDTVLDNAKCITSEELDLLHVARNFLQAYQNDDDQAILASSEAIRQESRYSQHLDFSEQEEQRIMLAQQRTTALQRLRAALTGKYIEQIVDAWDILLVGYKNVSLEEKERIALACDFVQACRSNDDQAIATIWQEIQSSRYQQAFVLTVEEEQRVTLAEKRKDALVRFRKVLETSGRAAEQIVLAYNAVLDDCQQVTPAERVLLQSAQSFMAMHQAVLDAIKADNDEQIEAVYDAELAQQFSGFTQEQEERLARVLKRRELKKALENKDYGHAIRLAQGIEMESRKPLTDVQLILAKQKFVKQFDVQNVEAWHQGNEVIVRWRWPSDDLIRYAVIVWRVDRWPHSPKRQEPGTELAWVFRSRNEQNSISRFAVRQQIPVYLQVYLAMPDATRQPPTWFYSTGNEPSSKTIAYFQGSNIQVS